MEEGLVANKLRSTALKVIIADSWQHSSTEKALKQQLLFLWLKPALWAWLKHCVVFYEQHWSFVYTAEVQSNIASGISVCSQTILQSKQEHEVIGVKPHNYIYCHS